MGADHSHNDFCCIYCPHALGEDLSRKVFLEVRNFELKVKFKYKQFQLRYMKTLRKYNVKSYWQKRKNKLYKIGGYRRKYTKYKKSIKHLPKIAKCFSKTTSYIIGYLKGDGWLHKSKQGKYIVGFSSVDKEFIFNFWNILKKWSGFDIRQPLYKKNIKSFIWECRIYSKDVFYLLKSFKLNKLKSQKNKIEFIKGFFDAEGYVSNYTNNSSYKNKLYKYDACVVGINNTNYEIMKFIKNVLKKEGIGNKLNITKFIIKTKSVVYYLRFTKFKDILNFSKKIGFRIKRKQFKLDNYIQNQLKFSSLSSSQLRILARN